MRIEYPELLREPAFNDLSVSEMKFVWYYANRTSPIFTPTRGETLKIKACIKTAFRGHPSLSASEYYKYVEANFPEKIKKAISVMEVYNPSARIRSRFAIERIFNNLELSLELNEEMMKEMDKDLDQKKKYIDLSVKVAETLPSIVAQLEEGYGIRTSSFFNGESKGMSTMDILHTTGKSG